MLKVKLDEYKVVGEDNDSQNVVLELEVKVKFGGYNDLPNVVLVSRWRREDYNALFTLTTHHSQ